MLSTRSGKLRLGWAVKAGEGLHRFANAKAWGLVLRVITIGTLLFATYVTIRYIEQPLADAHAFRQTQTALTSYWMLRDGWTLAYQTPVVGYPWSIPFEFPVYQGLVAAIVAISGFELEPVGRFVSYMFLVACAWPAFALSRRLALPKEVPWVFCALLWSSPLNVYWGRTFMIESAALFFSFACIPYGIDLIRRCGGWRSVALFVAFSTAAVLQKSTTGGPVLLFLLILAVFMHVRTYGLSGRAFRHVLHIGFVILVPLAIGLAWARYADFVKMANPFGSQLTSESLMAWNFGSLEQKLSWETWRLVIWERSIRWNAAGLLGVILLILPWLLKPEQRRYAWLSLAALGLFMLPVLVFTNLHVVHEYYQVACVAFLLAALAIVIGGWLKTTTHKSMVSTITTLVLVGANVAVFNSAYGIVTARSLDELDPRSVQSYKVGRYLRDMTPADTGLVVFGNGYSSEIAFQSQRKTMAVPPWFDHYSDLWANPQKYLGPTELAAIVVCPKFDTYPVIKGFPDVGDVQERIVKEPYWTHRTVYGCEVLLATQADPAE